MNAGVFQLLRKTLDEADLCFRRSTLNAVSGWKHASAIVVTYDAADDVSLRSLDLQPVGVADHLELCNGKLFEIHEITVVRTLEVDSLEMTE